MLDLYDDEMCYRFAEELPTDEVRTYQHELGEIFYWPSSISARWIQVLSRWPESAIQMLPLRLLMAVRLGKAERVSTARMPMH